MENEQTSEPSSNNENGQKKKVKTGNVARTDSDLADQANTVAVKWEMRPELILLWITASNFKGIATALRNALKSRKVSGSERESVSDELLKADKQLNKTLQHLKNYIIEKYEKEHAPAHYAKFGIVKKDKAYVLPSDRNERKMALELMLGAIVAEGLGDKKYGLNFWTAAYNDYVANLSLSVDTSGNVSGYVGTKNSLKKDAKLVLNSLVLLIKANYPETWKTTLREMGFQKEKY